MRGPMSTDQAAREHVCEQCQKITRPLRGPLPASALCRDCAARKRSQDRAKAAFCHCGAALPSGHLRRCQPCNEENARAWWERRRLEGVVERAALTVVRTCQCGECGTSFESTSRPGQVFCSKECRRKFGFHQRRAQKRSAVSERFGAIEVLTRDRWTCQLCGVKTPKRLRGQNHPQAPELDHIIPLERGGEHSRRNGFPLARE